MVGSSDWTELTFVLSQQLQFQEQHLPSSLASQLSFVHLQTLAPSKFFHPDNHESKFQVLFTKSTHPQTSCKTYSIDSIQPSCHSTILTPKLSWF